MANWYVKRGSETAGPLTQQRLKELATEGRIKDTDLIRKGEDGSFIEAHQIPGLLPDEDFETVSSSREPATKKINQCCLSSPCWGEVEFWLCSS